MKDVGYVDFWVAGDPAPQGSKNRDRSGRMYESSTRLHPWRDTVIIMGRMQRRRIGSHHLRVTLIFYYRVLADIDKLARAVLDGLTQSGMIDDDRYVDELMIFRKKGPHPVHGDTGCLITVEALG